MTGPEHPAVLLSGARIVAANGTLESGTVAFEDGLIADIRTGTLREPGGLDLTGCLVLPGFIDAHVHGLDGIDVLDGVGSVRRVAERLVRHGVTAFCPTAVAARPQELATFLAEVERLGAGGPQGAARVLPAHYESNFLNGSYAGAQPRELLCPPPVEGGRGRTAPAATGPTTSVRGEEVMAVLRAHRRALATVTLAPELEHGLALIAKLAAADVRVSLGHSAARYELGRAAVDAGARQVTHLFNRMAPFHHRDPGLAGLALGHEDLAAEVIADGFHLHPAVIRAAVAAKSPSRVLAISDGTAAAGLRPGRQARLGGRTISARDRGAYLDDGTLAGSVASMDDVFRTLIEQAGLGLEDAATVCAATPAAELGLHDRGRIAIGAAADVAILDSRLDVVRTYVDGVLVYDATAGASARG